VGEDDRDFREEGAGDRVDAVSDGTARGDREAVNEMRSERGASCRGRVEHLEGTTQRGN
jgi:hypothetical protein